jgi:hypothetical protein
LLSIVVHIPFQSIFTFLSVSFAVKPDMSAEDEEVPDYQLHGEEEVEANDQ